MVVRKGKTPNLVCRVGKKKGSRKGCPTGGNRGDVNGGLSGTLTPRRGTHLAWVPRQTNAVHELFLPLDDAPPKRLDIKTHREIAYLSAETRRVYFAGINLRFIDRFFKALASQLANEGDAL